MQARVMVVVVALAGCYAPTAPAGSPCGASPCPSPLVCAPATMTCEVAGGGGDAAPDGAVVVDGPPADAAPVDADHPDAAPVDATALPRYVAAVLADHPIGYFRLGEAVGATSLADQIVPGLTATIVGPVNLGKAGALAGDPDTAVGFDGATTSAALPAGTYGFPAHTPFSIEAWVSIATGAGAAQANVLRVGLSGSTGYGLAWSASGMTIYGYGVAGKNGVTTSGMNKGRFYHVVATYDGTTAHVYLDGVLAVSGDVDVGVSSGGVETTIGSSNNGGGSYFRGNLDELAIYDKALPADRVAAHHAAGI
jgi:hypothetical protein